MKVKTVDIARKLGISKATVSLALNGKPGVSEKTRAQILNCREEMEGQLDGLFANSTVKTDADGRAGVVMPSSVSDVRLVSDTRLIKILMIDRQLGILCDPVFNVRIDMMRIFDTEAQKQGYITSITYVRADAPEFQRVIDECNGPQIAGVILYATEYSDNEYDRRFDAIKKPMVVYDHDFSSRYHSVVIDNEAAGKEAVEILADRGCKRIEYLSQKLEMYNFDRRRRGFMEGIAKAGLCAQECPLIPVGTTVETVHAFLREYLTEHPLPDAFLTENYQISVGLMQALREKGVAIPGEVSVLGIDEIPPFMTSGEDLSCMRVPHEKRAYAVMELLLREIQSPITPKFKIAVHCDFKQGSTLR